MSCHYGAPVTALGEVVGVTEFSHKMAPLFAHLLYPPPRLRRLARPAVTYQRRTDHMERIVGVAAVFLRLGKGANDLKKLNHGTGPTVSKNERLGIYMTLANM